MYFGWGNMGWVTCSLKWRDSCTRRLFLIRLRESRKNMLMWNDKKKKKKRSRSELTLLRLLIDTRLHCVLVVHSSKSTMPDWIPWWDPWNASQLMTDVPPEPLPASRAHTSKPVVETDFTHSAAGSWILTYVLPWLREANTLTSLEPWNRVLKETDWQPWLFWDVSVMLTFPAWNTAVASEGNVRNKVNTEIHYLAGSASGQDESNRELWLATRAGKMEPSCPLGTTRCIPQAKFHQKPYNKSFID